jgi:UDP-N-acetylglucosamine acyltransferase
VAIDNYAIVGGASAIHQFVRIGTHCMISGGSLVRKDVPPFIKAGREPLSYAGVNSIGLRRRGFSSEKINEIQDVYRMLFLKNLNNSKALEAIKKELPASKERDMILSFVKDSERGILKGYTK